MLMFVNTEDLGHYFWDRKDSFMQGETFHIHDESSRKLPEKAGLLKFH